MALACSLLLLAALGPRAAEANRAILSSSSASSSALGTSAAAPDSSGSEDIVTNSESSANSVLDNQAIGFTTTLLCRSGMYPDQLFQVEEYLQALANAIGVPRVFLSATCFQDNADGTVTLDVVLRTPPGSHVTTDTILAVSVGIIPVNVPGCQYNLPAESIFEGVLQDRVNMLLFTPPKLSNSLTMETSEILDFGQGQGYIYLLNNIPIGAGVFTPSPTPAPTAASTPTPTPEPTGGPVGSPFVASPLFGEDSDTVLRLLDPEDIQQSHWGASIEDTVWEDADFPPASFGDDPSDFGEAAGNKYSTKDSDDALSNIYDRVMGIFRGAN